MRHSALVLLICLAGCTQPRYVEWFPDSDGFLYSDEAGSIASYDVRTRESTGLFPLERTELGSSKPGISPHGKQIAVFRVSADGEQVRRQVQFYDREGNQIRVSPTAADWRAEQTKDLPTAVYWSSQSDYLLLGHLPVHATDGSLGYETWVYNLEEDKLQPVADVVLSPQVEFALGISPVRPDGKGFLASKPDARFSPNPITELVWCDWNGKVVPLEAEESVQRFMENLTQPTANSSKDRTASTAVNQTQWVGESLNIGPLEIDTKSLKIRVRDDQEMATPEARPMPTDGSTWSLTEGRELRCIMTSHADRKRPHTVEVVVANLNTKETQALVRGEWGAWLGRTLTLSPDGKRAIVMTGNYKAVFAPYPFGPGRQLESITYHVINQRGEIEHAIKVDVSKK